MRSLITIPFRQSPDDDRMPFLCSLEEIEEHNTVIASTNFQKPTVKKTPPCFPESVQHDFSRRR
jgi:hypothetical protein